MGSRGSSCVVTSSRIFGSLPISSTFRQFSTQYEASNYHTVMNFSQDTWSRLSNEEREGVYRYTGSWYGDMNTALREGTGTSGRIKSYIDGATEALKKFRAAEDVIVYRGANAHWTANLLGGTESQLQNARFLRSRIGKTVVDKGFMSTGTHQDSAWSGINYTIFVHKGVEGMYVDPVSSNRGEKEFLFNRDVHFVVRQIKTDSRGRISNLVLEAMYTKH